MHSNMNGPGDDHTKRKTNTMWFHLYVESEKQDKLMNITEQNRLIDAKNKQVVARGKRIGGMSEIGEGD